LTGEIVRSLLVVLSVLVIIMLATIDLDHHVCVRTIKIEYIWPDRMLPPELPSIQTTIAQVMPQPSLGVGLVAS